MREKVSSIIYYLAAHMLPILLACIVSISIFIALFLILYSEPDICSLCEAVPLNAVCLINTVNGQVGELRLYKPHSTISNAIACKDNEIYHNIINTDYYTCVASPYKDYAAASIKGDADFNKVRNYKYYCRNCREKLNAVKTNNAYILADMYDLSNIKLYPLIMGEKYHIRHYDIEISNTYDSKKYLVEITSNYYQNGAYLDR